MEGKEFLILVSIVFMATPAYQQVPSTPIITRLSTATNEISMEWSQAPNEYVDNYTVSYTYVFRSCEGNIGGHMTVSGIPNSTLSYTLTQLEEYAEYTINIAASNQAGTSDPAMRTITTMKSDPSSIVQNFTIESVTATSINITWDRIECRHRNSEITSYTLLVYEGTTRILGIKTQTVNDYNHFLIEDLTPRTNYSITIIADDDDINRQRRSRPAIIYGVSGINKGVGFFFNRQIYSNNSAVDIGSLGHSRPLLCVTNLVECCSSDETGSDPIGSWTLPDGSVPPTSGTGIFMSAGLSAVSLTTRLSSSVTAPSGIYSCEIEDANNVVRVLHLYAYQSGNTPSAPVISSLQYNQNISAMICTSTEQLIESVTWYKNGQEIPRSSSQLIQSHRIIDRDNVVIEHILSGSVDIFFGTFTCAIQDNTNRTAEISVTLNGVNIVHSPLPLTVGRDETLTCVSELGMADRIEWTSSGRVLASESSIDRLSLTFSPVNDTTDIHGNDFVCSVHLSQQTFNQTLPTTVTVPHPPINVSLEMSGSLVAGSEYNLTCVVTKLYSGLTRSPGVRWRAHENNNFYATVPYNSTTENVSIATARFYPIYTSHSGIYICEGSLESPLLETPVLITVGPFIFFQIPAPVLDITQSEFTTNGSVNITLTCSATVNRTFLNFDSLRYIFTWFRDNDLLLQEETTLGFSQYTLNMPGVFQENITCAGQILEEFNRILASTVTNYTELVTVAVSESCLKTSISVNLSHTEMRQNLSCLAQSCPYLASITNLSLISVMWTKDGQQISEESIISSTVKENKVLSVSLSIILEPSSNYSCKTIVPYSLNVSNSLRTLETGAYIIPATRLYIQFCSEMKLEHDLSQTHHIGIQQYVTNVLMSCGYDLIMQNVTFQQNISSITFEAVIVSSSDVTSRELRRCLDHSAPNHISVSSLSLEVACTSTCPNFVCAVPTTTLLTQPESRGSDSIVTTDITGSDGGTSLSRVPSHIIAIVVVIVVVAAAILTAIIIILVAYHKRPRSKESSEKMVPTVELDSYHNIYIPEKNDGGSGEKNVEILNGLTSQVSSFAK